MKSIIFAFALALNCATLAFGKCAPQAFYNTIRTTPVIVYGALTGCKTDKETGMTTANLQIMETLKGELSEGKMMVRQLKVSFPTEIGGSVPQQVGFKNGDKKVFFLAQNADKSWRLIAGRCMTYQLKVNAKKQIILSNYENKKVSFDDFRNGIALFSQNFSDFETKKANNTDFKLENTTQNTTFALLTGEMFGKTFEIPTKSTEKGMKRRKKSKK